MDVIKYAHDTGYVANLLWGEFRIVMHLSEYYKFEINNFLKNISNGYAPFEIWRT